MSMSSAVERNAPAPASVGKSQFATGFSDWPWTIASRTFICGDKVIEVLAIPSGAVIRWRRDMWTYSYIEAHIWDPDIKVKLRGWQITRDSEVGYLPIRGEIAKWSRWDICRGMISVCARNRLFVGPTLRILRKLKRSAAIVVNHQKSLSHRGLVKSRERF